MIIITDTREQFGLEFPEIIGVGYKKACLPVGDYTASYLVDGQELMSDTVFERKSISDLFSSFTGDNYSREREKMLRYRDCGFTKYILAIERTLFDIRAGHSYRKNGEMHVSKKDGISMIRQLCTCSQKYGIIPMFFNGRREQAFFIQEYFLSKERMKQDVRSEESK